MGLLKTLCGGSSKIWAGLNNGTTTELAKQTEVESLKSSVSSGKAQIASAITGKGVSTSSSASFSTMATNIKNIKITTTIIQQVNGLRVREESFQYTTIPKNSSNYRVPITCKMIATTSPSDSGNYTFYLFQDNIWYWFWEGSSWTPSTAVSIRSISDGVGSSFGNYGILYLRSDGSVYATTRSLDETFWYFN